jgi:hypothetical protein
MNNKFLLGVLIAALFATAACTATVNTNANKPAASPTPTAAASPKPSSAASPAAATEGAGKGFALTNKTGVEIHSLYITPSESKDWQEDILGRDTLADGETTDITFSRSEKSALWDMRIEDSTGNSIEWDQLKLLELKKVTLYYKNGKATAEYE